MIMSGFCYNIKLSWSTQWSRLDVGWLCRVGDDYRYGMVVGGKVG